MESFRILCQWLALVGKSQWNVLSADTIPFHFLTLSSLLALHHHPPPSASSKHPGFAVCLGAPVCSILYHYPSDLRTQLLMLIAIWSREGCWKGPHQYSQPSFLPSHTLKDCPLVSSNHRMSVHNCTILYWKLLKAKMGEGMHSSNGFVLL